MSTLTSLNPADPATPSTASDARRAVELSTWDEAGGATAQDRRWPLTPLERFLLDCETPDSPMVIRVILRFRGRGDPQQLADSIRAAAAHHPLLRCRLVRTKRQLAWAETEFGLPVIESRSGSMPVASCDVPLSAIRLESEPALRMRIQAFDDGLLVVLDAHHAATDGGGLRQLSTDFVLHYHAVATGLPMPATAYEAERLATRGGFPQPASLPPISFRDAIRNFYVTVRGRTLRWPRKRGRVAVSEPVLVVERLLSDDTASAIRNRLTAQRMTLNDLVLAECFRTFASVFGGVMPSRRVTVLNPTDLRLPSDRALSAANRFGVAFLRRRADACGIDMTEQQVTQFAASFRDEMTYVRANRIAVEFLKGLATASRIPGGVSLMRRLGLFVPSMQFTCLGDVTRGGRRKDFWRDGMARPGELVLESVSGFAPFAPGVPLAVAVCEAGSQMSLTVCGSPRFVQQADIDTFADQLITTLTGAVPC